MTRRYLSEDEVRVALRLSRAVECLVGACSRDGQAGIRWLSIRAGANTQSFTLSIYDTADFGIERGADLYEYGPLNPELELDEPDEEVRFEEFDQLWSTLESRFPDSTRRLVNAGVIQDEYISFKAKG